MEKLFDYIMEIVEKKDFAQALDNALRQAGYDTRKQSVASIATAMGMEGKEGEKLRVALDTNDSRKPSYDTIQAITDFLGSKLADFEIGLLFGIKPKKKAEVIKLEPNDLDAKTIKEQVKKMFQEMAGTKYEDVLDRFFQSDKGKNLTDLYSEFQHITDNHMPQLLMECKSKVEQYKGGILSIGEIILIEKIFAKEMNDKTMKRLDELLDGYITGSLRFPKKTGKVSRVYCSKTKKTY